MSTNQHNGLPILDGHVEVVNWGVTRRHLALATDKAVLQVICSSSTMGRTKEALLSSNHQWHLSAGERFDEIPPCTMCARKAKKPAAGT